MRFIQIHGDVGMTSVAGVLVEDAKTNLPRAKKPRVIPYQPMLALHDVLVAACASIVGAWLSADVFFPGADLLQQALLLGLCMIPIAYFGSFRLYSYHLIYAPRYHLLNMCKAFVLSLLTLGIVLAMYAAPVTIPQSWFLPVVAMLVIGALLAGRFLWDQLISLLKAVGLACIIIGLAGLVGLPDEPFILNYGGEILSAVSLATVLLLVLRLAMVHLVFNRALRRRFRQQVLLIGANSDAERITDLIIRQNAPFWIAGTVSTSEDRRLDTLVPKSSLGRIKDLEAIVGEHFFQEVIITDELIEKAELVGLLDFFTSSGITIWFVPKLMPIIRMKLDIDSLCGMPMVRLSGGWNERLFLKAKYAFDAVIGLVATAVALPILLTSALAIALDSKGPVFYRPRAIGKGGRPFTMFKFRSMFTDASKRLHQDYVTKLIKGEIRQDPSGQPLKITNDPRVTRVGKFLRKTSLDELPQLINVLKGDMSLVGPRPCLPYEWEIYKDWHKKRSAVRPGITGLWQVVGRSEVTFEDMIILDLYYIYNRSFDLDLSILFETIFVVLKKKGAH
jgi:exopolysaccharide biosynthesis polyprenyl glycosylphosphotransferase